MYMKRGEVCEIQWVIFREMQLSTNGMWNVLTQMCKMYYQAGPTEAYHRYIGNAGPIRNVKCQCKNIKDMFEVIRKIG